MAGFWKWLKEWQSLVVGVVFGVPTLAFTAFMAWVYAEEVLRARGPDYMNPVLKFCGALCGFIFIAYAILANLRAAKRYKAMQAKTYSHPLPDTPLASATRETFSSLSISERLLVRHIYRHPKTSTAFLLPVLNNMGFPPRVSGDSLNKVLTTNLTTRDTHQVSPNPDIAEIVEALIERENWPDMEAVKSITAETTKALNADCNHSYNLLLSEETKRLGDFAESEYKRGLAEASTQRPDDNSSPQVEFADAIQARVDRAFAWWHIPVRAAREMRDCTVTVEAAGKRFEMSWILGNDAPIRRITLYPKQWVMIPLAARSDDKTASCSCPIAFEIAKGKACITALSGVVTGYAEIPAGKQLLRLQIRSDADPGRPVEQVYHLFNPPQGADNTQFYLRRWDEFGEVYQYKAESGGVEPHP